MVNALFAFDDQDAGRRAAQRLIGGGFKQDAVHVHARPSTPTAELSRDIDEQVTGGLVHNVLDLFQGIFEWGSSPHDASAYEETVRLGGTVVVVDADTDSERANAERLMHAAGCTRRTQWRTVAEP